MAFRDATAVRPLTADTYAIDLSDDWCIGSGTFHVGLTIRTARLRTYFCGKFQMGAM